LRSSDNVFRYLYVCMYEETSVASFESMTLDYNVKVTTFHPERAGACISFIHIAGINIMFTSFAPPQP